MKNQPIWAFAHFSLRLLVVAFVFSIFVSACSKSDSGSNNSGNNPTPTPTPTTSLVVSVIDNSGSSSSNTSVTLYNSLTDYTNQTNPIASKTTGSDGKATFSNLNPIVYYFSAINGSENNTGSTTKTPSAIIEGQTNNVSTTIRDTRPACQIQQTSGVTIYNNSSNPYDLEIDGVFERRMSGNTNVSYILSAGTHSFRATQVSGFVFTPTVRSVTSNMVVCQTYTWQFP